MSPLRPLSRLARFVLAVWVLALGAATASPLVRPGALALVCAASGVTELRWVDGDALSALGAAALDCPLCLPALVPPPVAEGRAEPVPAPAWGGRSLPPAPPVVRAAAPLAARGPPMVHS